MWLGKFNLLKYQTWCEYFQHNTTVSIFSYHLCDPTVSVTMKTSECIPSCQLMFAKSLLQITMKSNQLLCDRGLSTPIISRRLIQNFLSNHGHRQPLVLPAMWHRGTCLPLLSTNQLFNFSAHRTATLTLTFDSIGFPI